MAGELRRFDQTFRPVDGVGWQARQDVGGLEEIEVSVNSWLRQCHVAAELGLVDDLADIFPDSSLSFEALTKEALATLGNKVDLVVNTTSVGMYPQVDICPWPEEVPIPTNALFYDLVYNPLETVFLARARAAGATAIDGLGMLVHQGALAFEKWAGQQAPVKIMRAACLKGLGIDRKG